MVAKSMTRMAMRRQRVMPRPRAGTWKYESEVVIVVVSQVNY